VHSKAIAALIVGAVALAPVPSSAWLRTFTGGGNFGFDSEGPGLVVHPSGDIVARSVAGIENAVVRLDALTGQERWRSAPNDFHTLGVIAYPAGDVIACGVAPGSPAVARLDGATGAERWRRVLVNGYQLQRATIDAAGDVIVSGFGAGLVKLDGETGAVLWEYSLGPGAFDIAYGFAVAPNDDVVVAARTSTPDGSDAVAIRLAGATGAEVWRYVATGDPFSIDTGFAVGMDTSGDVVFLAALSDSPTRMLLAKLAAADGSEIWRVTSPLPGGSDALVDAAGDVYAVEYAQQVPQLVRRAGSDGAELWRPDVPGTGLEFTSAGSILVSSVYGDVGLATPSGQLLWTQTWGGRGGGRGDAIPSGEGVAVAREIGVAGGRIASAALRFTPALAGRQLRVADVAGDPAARTLKVQSKDPLIQAAADPNKPPAPTVSGTTLELRNPASGESTIIALPAANWRVRTSPTGEAERYTYHDAARAAGPCRNVTILRGKKITARCAGAGIGFTLDEASQGNLAVTLTTGSFPHCMLFGGVVTVDRPASGGVTGLFKAENAGPPTACP
jgi:outer membrane protein assembly factor BamB